MQTKIKILTGNKDLSSDIEKYVPSLLEQLDASEIKEMGFTSRDKLSDFIRNFMFSDCSEEYLNVKLPANQIEKIIRDCVDLCKGILLDEELKFYVFPTRSKFTIEKLGGSIGFCINKGIVFIGLYPLDNIENNLNETVTHEIPHAVSKFYNMSNMSVGEGIVFDGLAENYRESLKLRRGIITENVSKSEAKKIFSDIRNSLADRSFEKYSEVFFGRGNYPLWTGYSIGYYLIKEYLKSKEFTWPEILRKDPNEILNEIDQSGWV